jgi:hypothetical protein
VSFALIVESRGDYLGEMAREMEENVDTEVLLYRRPNLEPQCLFAALRPRYISTDHWGASAW